MTEKLNPSPRQGTRQSIEMYVAAQKKTQSGDMVLGRSTDVDTQVTSKTWEETTDVGTSEHW